MFHGGLFHLKDLNLAGHLEHFCHHLAPRGAKVIYSCFRKAEYIGYVSFSFVREEDFSSFIFGRLHILAVDV